MSKMRFPITTMEQIRAEPKRELTEDEKKIWYSKYHYQDMGEISEENLAALNAGPVAPELLLPIEKRSNLLLPGYQTVETGWGLLPDGTGLSCTNTFFPGATPDMLSWWFAWHPLEDLRYDIWCPNCHTHVGINDPEGNKDSSNISIKSRNWGKIHHPVEGFTFADAEEIIIKFYTPTDFGLDPFKVAMSPCEAIHGIGCFCFGDRINALFGDLPLPAGYSATDLIPFNTALHTARPVKGGCELRSRYWVGKTLVNGEPVTVKLDGFDYELGAWNNCRHSLMEYGNLSTFLPELYTAMGGKID
ncbi:MAG: hypothetical protein LUG13_07400 [Oscillospiraceae bacterium]|nr:hypothetical protein [Oscillospiraceae bacterium]